MKITEENYWIYLLVGGAGTVITILVALLLSPFTIINTGNKGVVYNWGAISEEILDEGFHGRLPIKQTIKEISVQPRQMEMTIEVGTDGAVTVDNQTVGTNLSTIYVFNKDHLYTLLKVYGEDKMTEILKNTVRENFKDVIGDYSIFDISTKREEIKIKLVDAVKLSLKDYPIVLSDIKVNNYDWSSSFDAQIEATMSKAQQVKQAEQELLITQQQAQKQVKEAEAAKQALITRAEGEKEQARLMADAKTLEGEGIRKYNESVAKNIELEIRLRQLEIDKIKAERWDGRYVATNNYTPIPFSQGNLLPN